MRFKLSPAMLKYFQALIAIPLAVVALQACAQEESVETPTAEVATADEVVAPVNENIPEEYAHLANALPGITISGIKPSPVEGLLEVSVGTDIFYVSSDGKYFLQAEMLELATRDNLTESARASARATYIDNLPEDFMVSFKAENEQYKVLVFTDIDCPYCRKLHREIADYNAAGITVEYLFFPRSGPGTDSWAKADAVWCAESRQDGMTAAKNGEVIESAEACTDTPTADHYQLGRDLGVTGTPAIFTESGELIVGYRNAADLKAILDNDEG
jgi:thiol:disulfide interchange protein DsbC